MNPILHKQHGREETTFYTTENSSFFGKSAYNYAKYEVQNLCAFSFVQFQITMQNQNFLFICEELGKSWQQINSGELLRKVAHVYCYIVTVFLCLVQGFADMFLRVWNEQITSFIHSSWIRNLPWASMHNEDRGCLPTYLARYLRKAVFPHVDHIILISSFFLQIKNLEISTQILPNSFVSCCSFCFFGICKLFQII